MTREEFTNVQQLQVALWPHSRQQPSGEHMEVVYELWRWLTYAEAVEALKALAADGREHAPPPGVVVAKASERRDGGTVEFDQVWEVFERANRLGAFHEVPHPDARARLEADTSPEVLAFVQRHYRDYAMSGGSDGDPVGVVRKQLRDLWEQRKGRRESEAAHGLIGVTPLRRVDSPGLRALPDGDDDDAPRAG